MHPHSSTSNAQPPSAAPPYWRWLLTPLLVLSGLALPGQAGAVGTPAGTVITNQAAASGTLSDNTPVDGLSNIVSTTVSPLCSVSVTPDGTLQAPGQQQEILPGESALFSFRVVNTGNDRFTTPVGVLVPAESAFTPTLTLYLDANSNGQLDADERTPISDVTLDADGVANVLVLAQTDDAQRGDGLFNLTAACGGTGGQTDTNNVALLRLGPPPVLSVTKTFSPAFVKPGDETTVTLSATNNGQGTSREVVLSDDLAALSAGGLSYVASSASVSGGTLESGSAQSWQAGDALAAQGLRVRQDTLAPGATLSLTFRMLAGAATENKALLNTAVAGTGNQTVRAEATLTSRYSPDVALGPIGQPNAPEGSPEDAQTKPAAVVGKPVCFDQSLVNTGDVRDSFTLAGQVQSGQAEISFQNLDGTPLSLPVVLEPGASLDFRVCFTPTQPGELSVKVIATGQRGSQNATLDTVQNVETGLPELIKTVTPEGLVPAGAALTYTLSVQNPYATPLNNVVVSDPLNAALDFVSADNGGQLAADAVIWRLPALAPGERRALSFKATVKVSTPDGTAIANTFTFNSDELPQPLPSNTVSSPVWSSKLAIEKTVDKAQVTYGDVLTYTLNIRNLSAQAPLNQAVVTDSPAVGLTYLPGTSTLAGQPLADPTISGGKLSWNIGDLPPSSTQTLTYQMRVTPQATATLNNSVMVSGQAVAGEFATAVASNVATRKVTLKLLTFANTSDLLGMVYLDRNRDGRFEPLVDKPLARARVLLAGGREVLTDAQGRYHFKDVSNGMQALRLDPASVPTTALAVPMDGGLSGTRSVNVVGLTAVDFPLNPLVGDIAALRSVSLQAGPLKLEKTVAVNGQRYTVTLRLSSTQTLTGFELSDPLPAGAVLAELKEGRNTLATTLKAGETTVMYTFDWPGERRAAVTEPDVRWTQP